MDQFHAEVAEWLSDTRPIDPADAVRAVFATLSRHVPAGQIDKVRAALPRPIRTAWEAMTIEPRPARAAEPGPSEERPAT